jgi:hypothetical protein
MSDQGCHPVLFVAVETGFPDSRHTRVGLRRYGFIQVVGRITEA